VFVVAPAYNFVGPNEEESGEEVGVLFETWLIREFAVDLKLLLMTVFHFKIYLNAAIYIKIASCQFHISATLEY
jgi:hypothetical protein